jgi:hypothetical protein
MSVKYNLPVTIRVHHGSRFQNASDYCDKAGYNWSEVKSMVEEKYYTIIGCELGIVRIAERLLYNWS